MRKYLLPILIVCSLFLTAFTSSERAAEAPKAGPAGRTASQNSFRGFPDNGMPAYDFDADFIPASAEYIQTIASVPSYTAATFSPNKISYQLQDGVLSVDDGAVSESITSNVASAGQLIAGGTQKLRPSRIIAEGGYVPMNLLDGAASLKGRTVRNGMIVVDPSNGVAFKVVSPTVFGGAAESVPGLSALTGHYAVARPELTEVVKDFTLEEDTIALTKGNIVAYAPNVEKNIIKNLSLGDPLNDFKYLSDDPLLPLRFDNEHLNAKVGNSNFTVIVSGGIGIDGIDLTGKYSCNGGYKVAMTLKQESYLNIKMVAAIHDAIRIPLAGLEVNFGVGRVALGIFAEVGVDGDIQLQIQAREMTGITLGVHGGTKLYIPTSVHKIAKPEIHTDGDVDLSGKINAYLKLGPIAELQLFGFDLVGAGVFLGAGVNVVKDGKTLDVTLYALFNVYIKFLGDTYNLVNWQLEIMHRKQSDTAGYRVKIVESFVGMPGRVGGILEKPKGGGQMGYNPAEGTEYRVLVAKEGAAIDPNAEAKIEQGIANGNIRAYPSSGYAIINNVGEFFQRDDNILHEYENAYLEFKIDGESYYSEPSPAMFPFQKIIITDADYFNDFAAGQVTPVRVINWYAPENKPSNAPEEEQYEYMYYSGGLVKLTAYFYGEGGGVTGGSASCRTDEFGRFDTSKPFTDNGKTTENKIYVYPNTFHNENSAYKGQAFLVTADHDGGTLSQEIYFSPTASFAFSRTVDADLTSHERYWEGDKLIDRMIYDEYILITNLNGVKAPDQAQIDFSLSAFSTQDLIYESAQFLALHTGNDGWLVDPVQYIKADPGHFVPLLDEYGNYTGVSELRQRIAVEWVWQQHPNPSVITTEDNIQMTSSGGAFDVDAEGNGPFGYSLVDAPAAVFIDEDSGLITVAPGISEGFYSFVVRAYPKILFLLPGAPDPRKGNSSVPAEQVFMLHIVSPIIGEGIAPVFAPQPHGYKFEDDLQQGDLTIGFPLSQGENAVYSLIRSNRDIAIPSEISVNSSTGAVTVRHGLAAGNYRFAVQAVNAYGGDTQICELRITDPSVTSPENLSVNYFIRFDHPADVYTNDRFSINGAEYVKWNEKLTLKYESAEVSGIVVDNSPVCDNYHYIRQTDMPQEAVDEIAAMFAEKLSDYQNMRTYLGERLNSTEKAADINKYVTDPDNFTYLNYGSVVDMLNNKKGGNYSVELGGRSGCLVTGKFFDALKNNPKASLNFGQEGVDISFKGKDISTDISFANELYNFGFSTAAPHKTEMLAAAPDGFTYSFDGHGALPGLATFAVETNFSKGEEVNVYKFDAETNKFTLVADKVKVGAGGLVKYKNNTLSEYVITTGTIAGAEISETVGMQGDPLSAGEIAAIASAAVVLAAVVIIIIVAKKKRNQVKN
jgi:hypothetical protein